MSLFGSTTQTKPSLFVSPPTGSNNQHGGGGLFGQSQQPQQQTGSSLFGQSQQQPQQSSSLFGQPQQQQQGSSLFGQPPQQQQQQSSSLFGQPQQQQQQPASLFGQSQPQQQNSVFNGQQAQPSSQSTGLFGATQQKQPSNGLFAATQPQQQSNSLFGGTQSQPQQSSRSIWQPGQIPQPREKTIPDQMQTLLEKWSPESSNCLFQHYVYNNVRPETVPYYGPGPGEDEAKWEEALAKKPSEDAIPVLCKGFAALGNRLRVQVQAVTSLQARLHEINSSLTAMLQAHDLDITVRTNDAKRRHVVLSQRCLQLATKIQVLKNRGYALDGAEEGLRKKLLQLERNMFDPRLNGRQEEIWARMVGLRERARFLQEEAEKTGKNLADNNGDAFDQETVKHVKRILGDYESQIAHLGREMETIKRDFVDWERGDLETKAGGR